MREHQLEALKKLKDGCILWGGVGAGKSRVAIAYYVQEHFDKDVVVITTAKKRDSLDWEGEAVQFGVGREESVWGTITVDSWNNIQKYVGRERTFFIFDEQRLVGSGTWVKAFLKIARSGAPWIMLSATPGDTWLDYLPVFMANGFFRTRTRFKLEHVLYEPYTRYPKVRGYMDEEKLEKLRDSILVEMPMERTTQRIAKVVQVGYDKELLQLVTKKRWNPYEDRPLRDMGEVIQVVRKVLGTDRSRLDEVRKLVEEKLRVIVFYNYNYELELLRELGKDYEVKEWNGHRHEPLPVGRQWVYLVQYAAGAEGWNCIETDTMLFWSYPYSYKLWEQAHGRIDRLNTPYDRLLYVSLEADQWIDKRVRATIEAKKDFNERAVGALVWG